MTASTVSEKQWRKPCTTKYKNQEDHAKKREKQNSVEPNLAEIPLSHIVTDPIARAVPIPAPYPRPISNPSATTEITITHLSGTPVNADV